MSELGKKQWIIPDMFWPVKDNGEYQSHEGICVVNANNEDCEVEIDFLYADRDPICGYKTVCKGMRTNHIRTDEVMANGEHLPRGTAYAAVIRCSVLFFLSHKIPGSFSRDILFYSCYHPFWRVLPLRHKNPPEVDFGYFPCLLQEDHITLW